MKTKLLIILTIGISGLLVPPAFSVTEELIHGSSSIELLPSEINPGKPTSFEIKFQYTEGPYALDNFIPVIEVSPASAKQYITIDVNPTGVTNRQILRIPVTLTVDPQIEHEKIFLSISFSGNHFSSRSDAIYKSAWSESIILNISSEKLSSTELPSSQDYEFESLSGARCDEKPSVCYGTFPNGTKIQIQCDYVRHGCGPISFDDSEKFYLSPLKQFKSGIPLDEIKCKEGLVEAIKKSDNSPACVKPETKTKLMQRGWAEPLGDVVFGRTVQPEPEPNYTLTELHCFPNQVIYNDECVYVLTPTDEFPKEMIRYFLMVDDVIISFCEIEITTLQGRENVSGEILDTCFDISSYTIYDVNVIEFHSTTPPTWINIKLEDLTRNVELGSSPTFTVVESGWGNGCTSPTLEVYNMKQEVGNDHTDDDLIYKHRIVYSCPFYTPIYPPRDVLRIWDESDFPNFPICEEQGRYLIIGDSGYERLALEDYYCGIVNEN